MNRQENEYEITLSSLAGGELYSQNNVISDFTNPLSTQVTLNGQWEVAVKKVSYHNNIINVHQGQNQIVFRGYTYILSDADPSSQMISFDNDILVVYPSTCYIFDLPAPGCYNNPEVFIDTLHNLMYYDEINHKVVRLGDLVNFEYLQATQTLQAKDVSGEDSFERTNTVKELTFSPELAKMMGLTWNEEKYTLRYKLFNKWVWELVASEEAILINYPELKDKPWLAYTFIFPYPVLWAANYKLYVSIDISNPPVLGNEHVNTLLSVPVTQEANTYTNYEPVHLTYKSVTKNTFNAIRCRVTDSEGNKIKFLNGSGAVTLQLHMRRVK